MYANNFVIQGKCIFSDISRPGQIKKYLALSLSDIVFIMLINVKMPTIVGILTFLSRIKFVLS